MRKTLPIIGLLSNPKLFPVFAVVSGAVFYVNYYAMTKLPGTNGYQCIIGGNFTTPNIVFSVLISFAAGLLGAGLVALYKQKSSSIKVGSTSTAGLIIGSVTTFCTLCTIPTLSLFGIGIGLGFITEYQLYFKAISLALLSIALYQMNRQLTGNCGRCVN